ncbi:polymorphic toxin-type HINT domain-containing protein [Clostridium oceanicum]|uniref:polymorphic toxin-type HINT domain-containing protein n=1 Tax=Clostridium oceanicum TaxID=1543 RepID=UPI003CD06801
MEHPFYVEGKGFEKVRDLRIEDKLKTSDNKIETVIKLESNVLNKKIKVYNFEVEAMHYYFVSKDKVLSHNNVD